jgi:Ca2+-transporting ATPase
MPDSRFFRAAAKKLLSQSIAINSTAFETSENGQHNFVGSTTESALLSFAEKYLGMGPINEERSNAGVIQTIPFDSGRKCMGCVVKLDGGSYRLYVKGASEIVLEKCSHISANGTQNIDIAELRAIAQCAVKNVIDEYASNSLRTIGIAYRDFHDTSWPPNGVEIQDDDGGKAVFDDMFSEMTFLSLVGIRDPLRSGVPNAVAQCRRAGVNVKMITGDNVNTARAVAIECGIYTQSSGGVVMEGQDSGDCPKPTA